MSKNSRLLAMFTEYCREHPSERFWQALRNWSCYNFIYGQRAGTHVSLAVDSEGYQRILEDTFYKES